MDNSIKVSGSDNLKSQTISKVVNLSAYASSKEVFTFTDLQEVLGIVSIEKIATDNAYGKYQELGQRNVIPVSFITISGNTVTLDIWGQVDTTNEATWKVTAIGK